MWETVGISEAIQIKYFIMIVTTLHRKLPWLPLSYYVTWDEIHDFYTLRLKMNSSLNSHIVDDFTGK